MTSSYGLRERLASGPLLQAPGAFDPLSAMLVEDAGYEAVYLSGGAYSRANGLPDLGLVSVTEVVGFIDRVCDSVGIPVIADLDTGYGGTVNVRRAVRAFEKAGVAAFHIEDQVFPKRCGHLDGKSVVPVDEMVGKIKSAVDARLNDGLVIVARTDARAVEGLDEAINRVSAYLDAGADVGFVEAPRSIEELKCITAREPRACFANIFEGGMTPFVPAADLESWGFRIAIYPSQIQRSAIWAIRNTLTAMRGDGSDAAVSRQMVTFDEREIVVRAGEWLGFDARHAHEEATT